MGQGGQAASSLYNYVAPRPHPISEITHIRGFMRFEILEKWAGASIPMGQGGHVPPIFGLGGIITNVPQYL